MTGKRLLARCTLTLAAFALLAMGALGGDGTAGAAARGQKAAPLLSPPGARFPTLPVPGPPRSNPMPPIGRDLRLLIRPAGIIFSGHVISIAHRGASSIPSPAATTITFQVDDAIRGVRAHERLTIREWAGLWARGERYRVGERVVLFLYPPGRLGFTSPVTGGMGRFGIDSRGRVVLNGLQIQTFEGDSFVRGREIIPYGDFVPALRRLIFTGKDDAGIQP